MKTMNNSHYNFLKKATRKELELYLSTLAAVQRAINKDTQSSWQIMNAYGRNPEAIIIAKESSSKKLFWAVGKIMRLQKETNFQFLPEEHQKLDDTIRYEWCEDFYALAKDASAALRAERP